MAGKVGHAKIFGYDFIFVFRHRYEKMDNDWATKIIMWNEWQLGFFFRKFKVVGRMNRSLNKETIEHVNEYMFGVNLLWCKMWFRVSKDALTLKIDKL